MPHQQTEVFFVTCSPRRQRYCL